MVCMKDIARHVGVSTTTVCHVLNKTRKVNPATAAKVLRASEELGYQSRKLKQTDASRRDVLGMIVSNLEDPSFIDTIRGFQEQARIQDMDAIVMDTSFDSSRLFKSVKSLIKLGVPGIVVFTTETYPSIVKMIQNQGICAVHLDGRHTGPLIGNLTIDYAHGIAQAIQYLKGLGHENIGYISAFSRLPTLAQRKQAFMDSLGVESFNPQNIIETESSVQGGYFACSKLLVN